MRSAEALHGEAVAATGLTDFGNNAYLEGLGVLLAATARAPDGVRNAVESNVIRLLIGRLHSQAGWSAHPAAMGNGIVRPVIITGLPRTGTTALHHLLSVDERFQWLPHWITATPKPRPPRSQWSDDDDYRRSLAALAERHKANPQARAAHNVEAGKAEECLNVMAQSFTTMMFVSSVPAPDYHEWFLQADEEPSYERYADNLRLIALREPAKPWLLKNPSHTFGMASLLKVFPDARIVMTYRDPVESIPSGASLIKLSSVSGWDAESLGRHRLRIWSLAAQRAETQRRADPERFFEADYRRIVGDPRSLVADIYQWLGLEIDDALRGRIDGWIDENPQGRHGDHHYTPEQFGLSAPVIRAELGDYVGRYGLAP
ncbi:MAG: sulfotransferase [Acidimicrobiia bacterium]